MGSLIVSNCTFEDNRAERYHANVVVGSREGNNGNFASGAAVGKTTPGLWEYASLNESDYAYTAPAPGLLFDASSLELSYGFG